MREGELATTVSWSSVYVLTNKTTKYINRFSNMFKLQDTLSELKTRPKINLICYNHTHKSQFEGDSL